MAFTLVETQGANSNSGTSATCTFGNNIALNNAIFAMYTWGQSGGGSALSGSAAVSDSVNSGNYTPNFNYFDTTNGLGVALWSIACNASTGKPVVTLSGLSTPGNNGLFMTSNYSGFTHGPLVVSADVTTNGGTGTAATGTSFNNSDANELLLALWAAIAVNTGTVSPSNWIEENDNTGFTYWDWFEATSGNNITYSVTNTGSSPWVVALAGFIDAPGSVVTAPIAWVS